MKIFASIVVVGLLGLTACGVVNQTSTGSNAGALAFDVEPGNADIFVDGALIGKASQFNGEDKVLEIPSGRHKIEIKADGCRPFFRDHYSSYATDWIRVKLECQ